MNADAFREIWSARIHHTADDLVQNSGSEAVFIGLFSPAWLDGKKGPQALMGLAGKPGCDAMAIARELRVMADQIERSVPRMAAGESFVEEFALPKPVRQ